MAEHLNILAAGYGIHIVPESKRYSPGLKVPLASESVRTKGHASWGSEIKGNS